LVRQGVEEKHNHEEIESVERPTEKAGQKRVVSPRL
jgi:hypothetical protein